MYRANPGFSQSVVENCENGGEDLGVLQYYGNNTSADSAAAVKEW